MNEVDTLGYAKLDAIETLSRLPDEASWEEIMYELYVTKKVNQAREQVAQGGFVLHGRKLLDDRE